MAHKLLLADDSVTIQRVIELTFADEDIQVIAVGDGRQAIERIEADRPDIVLADVGMPERDGYEVAAFVKNTAHLAHIPVLLLTGAFEPVDEQRASAAGCDGVLAKPFEPHMVITRVKELLAQTSAGPAAGGHAGSGPGAGPVPFRGVASAATDPTPAEAGLSGRDGISMPNDLAEDSEPTGQAAADVAAEVLADPSLRLSRRTPIAVPGFGAPAPPAESLSALDEYFDRLDAQFATLQRGPASAAPEPAEALPAGSPAQDEAAEAAEAPGSGADAVEDAGIPRALPPFEAPEAALEPRPPAIVEGPPPVIAFEEPRQAVAIDAAPPPTAVEETGPAAIFEPAAPLPPVIDARPEGAAPAPREPAAPPASGPPEPPPSIAQAFSALFAAERGEAPSGPVPGFIGPTTLPPAAMDDLVERVTRQVLDRMSDRVVRETVTEVVSRVSERLVREEIERVKATLK